MYNTKSKTNKNNTIFNKIFKMSVTIADFIAGYMLYDNPDWLIASVGVFLLILGCYSWVEESLKDNLS